MLFIDFVQLSIEASYNKTSSLRKMTKSSRNTFSGIQPLKQKNLRKVIACERNMHKNSLIHVCSSVEGVRNPWGAEICPCDSQPAEALPMLQQWQKLQIPIPKYAQSLLPPAVDNMDPSELYQPQILTTPSQES